MKRSLAILSLFLAFQCYSQTQVETALFSRIKAHRDTIGLPAMQWDSLAYKAAQHHANYLALANFNYNNKQSVGHTEDIDVDGFREFYTFDSRIEFFIPGAGDASENAFGGGILNNDSDSMVALKTINSWLSSKKGHKEIVESTKFQFGACAVSYTFVDCTFKTTDGTKTVKVRMAYSVFVVYCKKK